MEYIYMRIAVRKWSIDLKQIVQFIANNEERGFLEGGGTSYINPASLLNITPEIVDRFMHK
jgi:hypothetical protein